MAFNFTLEFERPRTLNVVAPDQRVNLGGSTRSIISWTWTYNGNTYTGRSQTFEVGAGDNPYSLVMVDDQSASIASPGKFWSSPYPDPCPTLVRANGDIVQARLLGATQYGAYIDTLWHAKQVAGFASGHQVKVSCHEDLQLVDGRTGAVLCTMPRVLNPQGPSVPPYQYLPLVPLVMGESNDGTLWMVTRPAFNITAATPCILYVSHDGGRTWAKYSYSTDNSGVFAVWDNNLTASLMEYQTFDVMRLPSGDWVSAAVKEAESDGTFSVWFKHSPSYGLGNGGSFLSTAWPRDEFAIYVGDLETFESISLRQLPSGELWIFTQSKTWRSTAMGKAGTWVEVEEEEEE